MKHVEHRKKLVGEKNTENCWKIHDDLVKKKRERMSLVTLKIYTNFEEN